MVGGGTRTLALDEAFVCKARGAKDPMRAAEGATGVCGGGAFCLFCL